MNTDSPSREEWKKLYELMARIKELAPWDWMKEDDIFGFQLPGKDTPDFISVMGTLGEHLSVAVYLGAKGLGGFLKMQELGQRLTPEFVLQVPQLQASFENREIITDEDRKVIKELGLKFRGANTWPQFRSFRPGCYPWHIERSEAELLTCALEQLLEVAPRFENDPDIFKPTDSNDDYLVRVKQNDQWEDVTRRVELREGTTLHPKMNGDALRQLKSMKPGNVVIEADFFMMNHPTQNKRGERPFFPFMLILVEQDSGFILASEILTPLPTIESMWEEIPRVVVEKLAGGFAPGEIQVKNEALHQLLQTVAKEAGFAVRKAPRLRAIELVRREMKSFLGEMT